MHMNDFQVESSEFINEAVQDIPSSELSAFLSGAALLEENKNNKLYYVVRASGPTNPEISVFTMVGEESHLVKEISKKKKSHSDVAAEAAAEYFRCQMAEMKVELKMTTHISWTGILGFHNVRLANERNEYIPRGTITYRAKVKLHGTCGIIRIDSDGKVTPMSRDAILEDGKGLNGFAAWVTEHAEEWRSLRNAIEPGKTLALFGEWVGPGVQEKVATSKIPAKFYAVFAARVLDEDGTGTFITDPEELSPLCVVPRSCVLPWYSGPDGEPEKYEIDWKAPIDQTQPVLDRINESVESIEKCDPWVKLKFGVEGTGEGLVLYPETTDGYAGFSNMAFKAKGSEHRVVGKSKPAQHDASVMANAQEFAHVVLTAARLEQGAKHVGGGELVYSFKTIPSFLTWIKNDVQKECQDELRASNIDEKNGLSAVESVARTWYLMMVKSSQKTPLQLSIRCF